jgi:predicted small secreted protein
MKTSKENIVFLILSALLFTLAGTSCRTFRGMGQDVEHAGQHIENAAKH